MKKLVVLALAAICSLSLLAGCGSKPAAEAKAEASEAAETETKATEAVEMEVPETEAAATEDSEQQESVVSEGTVLEDGVYSANFDTDSSMFHVNEALDGKGTLTVKDGQMTIHVTLASKGILNLYPGLAEDAQKDGAVLLEPSTDTVNYSDGTTDEAYGFDVPVPYLDEEFDLALIGKKGVWYDHKVSVSNAEPVTE